MIKILLDTNFLIYCAENKIDYATEILNLVNEGIEFIVPKQVIDELNEIVQKSKKLSDRTAAFLALKILEHNKVKVIEISARYADDALFNLVRVGTIVATLDLELRKRLEGRARILLIRGKKKIDFE